MLKNALNRLAKRSNKTIRPVAFEKRSAVLEVIMNDHRSRDYNPRSARHKSLKSIFDK